MKVSEIERTELMLHDGITLSAKENNVIRDKNGVPVEWTLLRIGGNAFIRNGRKGVLHLTREDMESIMQYFYDKGELIPLDSNHYLHYLANEKNLEESECLRLIPSGVAAMGFGTLFLRGEELRIKVKWNPAAYRLMQEKIYRYFSPAIRGLVQPPLRVTSVALENEPAINHLDSLAASAVDRETPGNIPDHNNKHQQKEHAMTPVEKALSRLLGRDTLTLSADPSSVDDGSLAAGITEKVELLAEFRRILNLQDDVPDALLVPALQKLISRDEDLEKLRKELNDAEEKLKQIRIQQEKKQHDELLEQGIRDGKITPSTREWWGKLDNVQLSAHLAAAPVIIPQGITMRDALPAEDHYATLTAEDRAACQRFGFKEEDYLLHKKKCID